MTPATLRLDLLTSKALIEDTLGVAVQGYRAPCFSLTAATRWARDVIADTGFAYDSSVFPTNLRRDSWTQWNQWNQGLLPELPALTLQVGRWRLPAAGGAYLRHLPVALMTTALRQAATRPEPAVLYTHPWEYDPHQPQLALSRRQRLRTYGGLHRTAAKLQALLHAAESLPGQWVTCQDAVGLSNALPLESSPPLARAA